MTSQIMTFWLPRLGRAIVVLVAVCLLVSQLTALLPGDPALLILGQEATEEQLEALRNQLGLNQGYLERTREWFAGILSGDWGTSFTSRRPVLTEITARIPVTAQLVLSSTIVAALIALPVAMYSARHVDRSFDKVTSTLNFIILATPSFVLGLVLIYLFSVRLGWLPASGFTPFTQDPLRHLSQLVLPVLTLALAEAAVYIRTLRSSFISTLGSTYIDATVLRGASPQRTLWTRALRPSISTTVALVGLNIGAALGGTLIIENLFSIPGLGRLTVSALGSRDLPMIQGTVLFSAIAILVMSLVVDAVVRTIDPRSTRDRT